MINAILIGSTHTGATEYVFSMSLTEKLEVGEQLYRFTTEPKEMEAKVYGKE